MVRHEDAGETPRQSAEIVGDVSARRVIQAVVGQSGFRIIGIIASLFTVAITTRYLGPEHYGYLQTAIFFVTLFSSLTELGIGDVIVRRAASGRGDLERMVRVNAGLSALYALPLAAVTAGLGLLLYDDPEVRKMILVMSASLTLMALANCVEPVFVSTVRFAAVGLSDFLSRIAILGGTLLLVRGDVELFWFAAVQLLPPLVVLIVQGFAASRIITYRPVVALREAWSLLKEALPQTAVLIIGVLYWRIDGVILSFASTADQVGVYGLAMQLAFNVTMIAQFLTTATASTMAARFARDVQSYNTFVAHALRSMYFVAVPVVAVGIILAGPIVALIGSDSFHQDGRDVLAILWGAVAIGLLNGPLSQALFAAHQQQFLMRLNLCTLALNIAANLVLVGPFGARGAACALLLTEAVGFIAVNWRLVRKTGFRIPLGFLARLIIPTVPAVIVAVALHDMTLFLSLPLAAATYLVVNLLVGPVTLPVLRGMIARPDSPDTDADLGPVAVTSDTPPLKD